MSTPRTLRRVPGLRLTLFSSADEQVEGRSLADLVLDWAREAGIRTAIVTSGTAGFGRRRVVQTANIEVLTARLPLTLECVDESERIERLLERVRAAPIRALVEVQRTSLVVAE